MRLFGLNEKVVAPASSSWLAVAHQHVRQFFSETNSERASGPEARTLGSVKTVFNQGSGWLMGWMSPGYSTFSGTVFTLSLIGRIQGWFFDSSVSRAQAECKRALRTGSWTRIPAASAKLVNSCANQLFTYNTLFGKGLGWYRQVTGAPNESLSGQLAVCSQTISRISSSLELGLGILNFGFAVRKLCKVIPLDSSLTRVKKEGFELLEKQVTLDANEIWEKMRGNPSSRKHLEKIALEALVHSEWKSPDGKVLSASEARSAIKGYFAYCRGHLDSVRYQCQPYLDVLHLKTAFAKEFSLGEAIGFFILIKEKQERKKELLDSDCVKKIQQAKARGLAPRLHAGGSIQERAVKEFETLVDRVRASVRWGEVLQIVKMVLSIAVIIMGITSFLALIGVTGGAPLWVVLIGVALAWALMIQNGLDLRNGIKGAFFEGSMGAGDRFGLMLLFGLYSCALTVSAVLIPVLNLPLIELLKTSLTFALGAGLYGAALKCVSVKERAWKQKHPDLAAVREALTALPNLKAAVPEKMTWMVKKLPKQERQAVREAQRVLSSRDGRFSEKEFKNLFADQRMDLQSQEKLKSYKEGIKRTCKKCWCEYNKTEAGLQQALALQALFEATESEDGRSALAALAKVHQDAVWYARLREEIKNVFKERASSEALLSAVERIERARRYAQLVA